MRGDMGRGQRERHREGDGWGGEGALDVCNLLIEEHLKVISVIIMIHDSYIRSELVHF